MATKNDLYTKLISMKSGIEDKGGTVTVLNLNPSPDELIAGIASIENVNNQNKTITPTTSQQQISADETYTGLGVVTINAVTNEIDSDILAGNIKKDVNILGVTGTLEVIDVSDTTAVATDVLASKDFYLANGTKTTGTIPTYSGDTEITENGTLETEGTYLASDIVVNVSGGVITEKDINFYDLSQGEKTLVASYELSELPLSSLPTVPTHNGLTSQGWNWSLTDINALTGKMDIGAVYKTDDGKTRFYITLTTVSGLSPTLRLYKISSGTLVVAWGDGNTSNITSTGSVSSSHTYSSIGDYVITITFTRDYRLPQLSSSSYILGSIGYNQCLTKIELSEYVTRIYDNSLFQCTSLKTITIPNSVTLFGSFSFWGCYSLIAITIPNSVTTIDGYVFYDCYSLTKITIPNSVTVIYDYAFYNCYSLTKITIPNSITSIKSNLFYNCYSILEYYFTIFTSVPTLENINTFYNINNICKIYVPSALYDDWIVAPNWVTYADYIVAV